MKRINVEVIVNSFAFETLILFFRKLGQIKETMGTCALNRSVTKFNILLHFRNDIEV